MSVGLRCTLQPERAQTDVCMYDMGVERLENRTVKFHKKKKAQWNEAPPNLSLHVNKRLCVCVCVCMFHISITVFITRLAERRPLTRPSDLKPKRLLLP